MSETSDPVGCVLSSEAEEVGVQEMLEKLPDAEALLQTADGYAGSSASIYAEEGDDGDAEGVGAEYASIATALRICVALKKQPQARGGGIAAADVLERIAAAEGADPASDDLTIPLAVQLVEAERRIAELQPTPPAREEGAPVADVLAYPRVGACLYGWCPEPRDECAKCNAMHDILRKHAAPPPDALSVAREALYSAREYALEVHNDSIVRGRPTDRTSEIQHDIDEMDSALAALSAAIKAAGAR